MKKCFRHFKAILLLIMMAMLISVNGKTVYADKSDFTVEVKYGYDNKVQIGSYMPVYVTVTNNAQNFEGAVQIIVPGQYYNTMHEKEFSIAAGDTKTIMLTAPFYVNAPQFTVRIVDKDKDVVWKDYVKTDVLKSLTTANIGVLSDDFSALSYMSNQKFLNYSDLSTKIYELTAENLPEDYKALDMLDVIVISNFSTDKLTENQIEAIDLWIDNGGLLLLGSGSTVNKTFAGFNGKVFDAVIGEYKTYSTKFGLDDIVDNMVVEIYDYDYRDNYFEKLTKDEQTAVYELLDSYKDSWYSDYYENFFYTFYENNQTELETWFKDIFFSEYYGTKLTEQEWKDYGKNEFYYFVYDVFDRLVVIKKREAQIADNLAATDKMQFVDADILNVTLKGQGMTLYGEIEESDKKFPLVNAISKGNGIIAVAGLDFTQNPLASYSGNKLFFVNLIETLIGDKVWDNMNSYSNYYYYETDEEYHYLTNLAEAVNSAPLPPMLIYIVIIGIYLIGGLVVYFILRKRKKSMLFWGVQAILALAFAGAVYIAGFTTRKISPEFNTAVITELSDDMSPAQIKAVGKLLMPKMKAYEVSFLREYNLKLLSDNNYYGMDLSNRDYDDYYLSESISIDAYNYEFRNTQALGNQGFIFSRTEDTRRNVDISLKINDKDGTYTETKIETDAESASIPKVYVSAPTITYSYSTGTVSMKETEIAGKTTSSGLTYSYTGDGLAGVVTNNYGVTLEDAIIFFEGEFYLLGDIAPGGSVNVEDAEVIPDQYYRYNMELIFGDTDYGMDEFLFGDTISDKSVNMKKAFYQYVNNTVVNPSYYSYGSYPTTKSGAFFFAFPSESDHNVLYNDNITENIYEMVCKWIALEDIEGITISYGEGY